MSAVVTDWDTANTAFLTQALAWLRWRLSAASGDRVGSATPPTEPDWSTDALPPPALVMLSQRFSLSVFETKILLLCAAVELDPAIGALCARADGADARRQPTFSLCLRLFTEASWEALSPHQPLRAWRLIERGAPGGSTLITSPLRTDERIVHFMKGLNEIDERISIFLLPHAPNTKDALASSQTQAVAAIARAWQAPDRPLVVLTGTDAASKLLAAEHAAANSGLVLCRTTWDVLPNSPADVETFERLWRREQMLLPLAMLIEAEDIDAETPDASIRRLLTCLDGPIALAAHEAPRVGRAVRCIEVTKPTRVEQERLWIVALGETHAALAGSLAGQFSLSTSVIGELARRVPPSAESDYDRVWSACRETLRPRLDKLAQRIDPRADWSDLVLPTDRTDLLQQIVSQVRNHRRIHEEWGFAARSGRGLGITALFAGESGTGKTLAAEVLASTLDLDLYRIDLSGVVSKYIGETEKNLRRLFDAAEESGAILFFDEADALFGKRSEVRDSHDRYANIEVNYLLQRIEAYRGLAILATNLRSALDPAFLRRLRFVVTFPYPSAVERQAIWKRAFPDAAKVGDLDWAHLGRLNLTGGNIATVALNAAFLACAENDAVAMRHLLAAARAEYVKLDRPFRESDFLVPVQPELSVGSSAIGTERVA